MGPGKAVQTITSVCFRDWPLTVRFYKVDNFDLEKAFDGGAGQA